LTQKEFGKKSIETQDCVKEIEHGINDYESDISHVTEKWKEVLHKEKIRKDMAEKTPEYIKSIGEKIPDADYSVSHAIGYV